MNALEAGRLEPESERRADHGDALRVTDLRVSFETRSGSVEALRGVSFEVAPGERLGLVGESGSGKSVACLAILGLLDHHARVRGRVQLGGADLLALGKRAQATSKLAMIFQYP
jgi:ABC-type glutathione transport system ATPase component